MTRTMTPRQRLTHLLVYLRRGQQMDIALRVGCSPGHVSAVLNGKTGQDTDLARNIIRLAEHFTHRNNLYKKR